MDAIDVRIFDGGQVTLEGRYTLPVTIGRSSECTIRVADPDGRISRFHATLTERVGALGLADTSLNGTQYRGRTLNKAEATIENVDEFTVQRYRVEVRRVQAAAAEPVIFHAVVHSRSRELTYAIGPTSLVLLLEDQRGQVALVRPKEPAAILAAYAAEGREALAVIAAKDGFGIITTTPAALKRGLLINRGAPRGDTERLRVLDVVSIGHLRIEILEKDQRALKCKNHECELLNPYEADENCRFCGHRLVEAQTRVIG